MSADPSKLLHPQAYDALAEGLATFQCYKAPFSQMMTALIAADSSVLAGTDLQGSTKREVAREVVRRLQGDERRFQSLTVGVLITLADYDPGFGHLARLEDGPDKVRAAQNVLSGIKRVIGQHSTRAARLGTLHELTKLAPAAIIADALVAIERHATQSGHNMLCTSPRSSTPRSRPSLRIRSSSIHERTLATSICAESWLRRQLVSQSHSAPCRPSRTANERFVP